MGRNLQSGKMQFNVKEAKGFRDTLAKWHNADFELAVAIDKRSKTVRNYMSMIETDNDIIAKMDAGEKIFGTKTRSDLVAEIADFNARIESENKALKELRDVQAKRLEGAYALLTTDLHKAYVAYVKEGKRAEYVEALCVFFESNGLVPTLDGINAFVACVGKKKATTRTKIEQAKHNDAFSYRPWRDIFLGELCDEMGSALPIEKFIYQSMEERVKAWEQAKNNK